MKKILLALGTTLAVVAPVTAVISCDFGKKTTKPGEVNPKTKTTTPGTQGGQQPILTPISHVLSNHVQTYNIPYVHQADEADQMAKFKVTEVSEDPKIDGYLDDVQHGNRDFRVYDNGLFKIKIQKSLIGQNRFFASGEKAQLEAAEIAETINFGPAITHLPKGIQILDSGDVASLGGNAGVQIAVNNNSGSVDDNGLRNETALVDHEYGHHETLWDAQNIMGLDIINDSNAAQETLKDAMSKGLRDAGYTRIADIVDAHVSAQVVLNFMGAASADFPTDYGKIQTTGHSIFDNQNYPFNSAEIATRVLNILSYRTDLTAAQMYGGGTAGTFSGTRNVFEPAAALVSDATIKHFAGETIFGGGKDNSRASKLIDFYMNKIFGLGKAQINLLGNANNGKIDGIDFSSFGAVQGLDNLELQDSAGNVVRTIPVSSFNSRFGFKDELISNKWSTIHRDEVDNASISNLNININTEYKLVGKDKDNKEVDLSKVSLADVHAADKSGVYYPNAKRMAHEGTHLVLSQFK